MLQTGNDDSGSYISGDNSSDYKKGKCAAALRVVRQHYHVYFIGYLNSNLTGKIIHALTYLWKLYTILQSV